jgi:hypothetical protein
VPKSVAATYIAKQTPEQRPLLEKLEGAGKTQRMLKVRRASDVDAASIARWLKAASAK